MNGPKQWVADRLTGTPGRRRSAWSLLGLGGNAVLTLVAVIATTNALGVETYGVYVGMAAYVGLLAPFTIIGTSQVLVSKVSLDREAFGAAWGTVLASFVLIGTPLFVAAVLLASVILPDRDLVAIALFALAEYVGVGLLSGHGDAAMSLERYDSLAYHFIAVSAVRAIAGLSMWFSGSQDVRTLALLQLAGMVLVAVGSARWLLQFGRPTLDRATLRGDWRHGSNFAWGRVSDTIQTNVDRTMLLRYGFDADAALYGAGVRLISYGVLPARSVLTASYTEFFRRGANGIDPAVRYARTVAKPALGLTILGTLVAVAGAPIAVRLFGEGFDDTVLVVFLMAGFPLLRTLQKLIGNVLTGAGHQADRARAQFGAAIGNVALNLALIPRYQWRGAIAATYLTEIGFVLALTVLVLIRRRRSH